MSKLSFRARALDASKPMPIYRLEDLPELPDYSAINRAVPQMPSGMEKEEECEHHLQRAICAGLIIPTPQVADMADVEVYDKLYENRSNIKLPRQLIHMQPFAMEQDIPDYDMDSEDEVWVNMQAKKMDFDELKFEEMMDRLEKASGQTVLTLQEAKSLLKEDDDLIIAVYDYWLNKRLKYQTSLIPTVKTEHRLGAANNPYLAFRRRTEKMQTRKNRKNDETSYEKMLKLRRDLSRAVTLLEQVKRREKTKREYLHLTIEIYEKRYQGCDFSGQMLAEVSALKTPRPAFAPLFTNQFGVNHQSWPSSKGKEDGTVRKEKRQYKKRKHKASSTTSRGPTAGTSYGLATGSEMMLSSEDEVEGAAMLTAQSEEDAEHDPAEEPFAFRRKKTCNYQAPLLGSPGNWPWNSREEGGAGDRRYRYCLTSISKPERKCIGFARRRVGRGGRVILDRATTSIDDLLTSLDFTVIETPPQANSFLNEVKNDWLHFRPKTPPPSPSSEDDSEFDSSNESLLASLFPDGMITMEVPGDGNVFTEDSIAQYNVSEMLASGEYDYQLGVGGYPIDDSPILERLGHLKTEPDLDTLESLGESSRNTFKSESPHGGKVGHSEFGCSKFTIQPSSSRHTKHNSITKSEPNSTTPSVKNRINRRKKQCSIQLTSSNYLASPTVVTNCADHGYSNGGLVSVKTEDIASINDFGASGDRIVTSGWSGGHAFTNGPVSTLPEYPGSSRGQMNPLNQVNCFYSPSNVPSPFQQRSSSQPRPPSGSTANYLHPRTITIKPEPEDEKPTLISGDLVDVEPKEKASNQVCVDKKQLVRKNNSLPMEVT